MGSVFSNVYVMGHKFNTFFLKLKTVRDFGLIVVPLGNFFEKKIDGVIFPVLETLFLSSADMGVGY